MPQALGVNRPHYSRSPELGRGTVTPVKDGRGFHRYSATHEYKQHHPRTD